jgi:molecular chaperone DnaK
MPELQQCLYTIGSNIYQQSGGAEAAANPPEDGETPSSSSGSDGSDDVIDAEFSETK